jgi:hypothetical protein
VSGTETCGQPLSTGFGLTNPLPSVTTMSVILSVAAAVRRDGNNPDRFWNSAATETPAAARRRDRRHAG